MSSPEDIDSDYNPESEDKAKEIRLLHDQQILALEAAKRALTDLNRRTQGMKSTPELSDSKEEENNSSVEFTLSDVLNSVHQAEVANEKAKRKMEDLENENDLSSAILIATELRDSKRPSKSKS